MSTFTQQADQARRRAATAAFAAPPKLPITYVNVRPLNGAIVYTFEGTPIPQDQWSAVPISAGVINAIKYGDLEEGEIETEGREPTPRGRRHRHHRHHRAEETA